MNVILLLTLAVVPSADPPLPEGAIARLGSPVWRDIVDNDSVLAFTPDGSGLIVTHTGSLRAIDFATGRERWKAPEVGWLPDGTMMPNSRLVVGNSDWLRIYDATNGRLLKQHARVAVSLSDVSSDGRRVAFRDEFGRAVVIDLDTGGRLGVYGGKDEKANCVPIGFVPNQPLLAIRVEHDEHYRVRLVDFAAKTVAANWELPRDWKSTGPNKIALSPDGNLLCVSVGKTIRRWDVTTGKEHPALAGPSGAITALAFSADGKRLVAASADGMLLWWDTTTGREFGRLEVYGAVHRLAVSADGTRAAAICEGEATVRRFDLKTGRQLLLQVGHTEPVERVIFLPGGQQLISIARDDTVRIWDIAGRGELRRWAPQHANVNAPAAAAYLAVSADGKLAATGSSQDAAVHVWDVATAKRLRKLDQKAGFVTCMDFAPTGATLAVGIRGPDDHGGSIQLWDAADGRALGELASPQLVVGALTFHPDGRRLLATADHMYWNRDQNPAGWPALLWDIPERRATTLSRSEAGSLSPDGRSALLIRQPLKRSDLSLVELASGQERLRFGHVPGPDYLFALSPDGRLLVTFGVYARPQPPATREAGVRVWDAETGRELRRFDSGHTLAVAFSSDGRQLATASV
jgi:WD40 repeat protein